MKFILDYWSQAHVIEQWSLYLTHSLCRLKNAKLSYNKI